MGFLILQTGLTREDKNISMPIFQNETYVIIYSTD